MQKRSQLLLVALNYLPLAMIISLVLMGRWYFIHLSIEAGILSILASLYVLPVVVCRLGLFLFGHPKSGSKMYSRDFFIWWFTLQTQAIFLRLPFLEEVLRFVPGLYSTWLRLWGAKVGKFVFWSAGVRIMDRPFLKCGDKVVFGFGSTLSSHVWNQKDGEPEFIFAPIVIGSQVLIGAKSSIAAGVKIAAGQMIPATTLVPPGKKIGTF